MWWWSCPPACCCSCWSPPGTPYRSRGVSPSLRPSRLTDLLYHPLWSRECEKRRGVVWCGEGVMRDKYYSCSLTIITPPVSPLYYLLSLPISYQPAPCQLPTSLPHRPASVVLISALESEGPLRSSSYRLSLTVTCRGLNIE